MKNSILRLLRNLKYLSENNIKECFEKVELKTITDIEQNYIYELSDKIKYIKKPHILDYYETLEIITTKQKSFCRIGDGEIDIMIGKDIPFQKYDPKLAGMMMDILQDDKTDMYVGINYSYFYTTEYMDEVGRRFYLMGNPHHRKFLMEKCNMNRTYINATFNQIYMGGDIFDHEYYYDSLKKMFKGRKLAIFVGEGVLDNLKYDLFELSQSKTIIYGPAKDSFSEFDSILEKAMQFTTDYVLCFILGPTSKILVHKLTQKGYMAWDIGHMAKDYNAFKEKKVKDNEFINSFYAPD